LEMLVSDYQLSKKHVNLYEPVWIYPEDSKQPLELVVNKIEKDSVHGYVSAPKYAETQQAAQSAVGGAPSATVAASIDAKTPVASVGSTASTPSADTSRSNPDLLHRPSPPQI
jgi:hypothetical protein